MYVVLNISSNGTSNEFENASNNLYTAQMLQSMLKFTKVLASMKLCGTKGAIKIMGQILSMNDNEINLWYLSLYLLTTDT